MDDEGDNSYFYSLSGNGHSVEYGDHSAHSGSDKSGSDNELSAALSLDPNQDIGAFLGDHSPDRLLSELGGVETDDFGANHAISMHNYSQAVPNPTPQNDMHTYSKDRFTHFNDPKCDDMSGHYHSPISGSNSLPSSTISGTLLLNQEDSLYQVGGPEPLCLKIAYAGALCQWADCGEVCPSLTSLVTHVNTVHGQSGPLNTYVCQWRDCSRRGKAFDARYKLVTHLRTHTYEKPHICNICGKGFTRVENRKIHIRSHTGEKPYHCTHPGCSKAYANSADRFKHMKAHREHKPYQCKHPGCRKRYTDPSSLRKHMRMQDHSQQSLHVLPPTLNESPVSADDLAIAGNTIIGEVDASSSASGSPLKRKGSPITASASAVSMSEISGVIISDAVPQGHQYLAYAPPQDDHDFSDVTELSDHHVESQQATAMMTDLSGSSPIVVVSTPTSFNDDSLSSIPSSPMTPSSLSSVMSSSQLSAASLNNPLLSSAAASNQQPVDGLDSSTGSGCVAVAASSLSRGRKTRGKRGKVGQSAPLDLSQVKLDHAHDDGEEESMLIEEMEESSTSSWE